MFLPIGDSPNPPGFRAWMNWLLIAINLAIYVGLTLPLSMVGVDPRDPRLIPYLDTIADRIPPGMSLEHVAASLTAWDLFVWEHGYKPGAPEISDLFASMFLHAGLAHVAGNMLFLWIYGDNVEHRLGRLGYVVAYLLTGAAATLGFSLLAGDSLVPMVGASGAISGVLGMYFLMFPRNRVRMFVALFPFVMNVFLVPARLVLGAYVVLDNVLPLLGGAQSGVAYGAHLGGFFAGLGLAFVGDRLGWRAPWADRTARIAKEIGAEGSLEALRRAIARGDERRAIGELGGLSWADSNALTARERLVLGEWLARAGHGVAAIRLLRAGLPRADEADRARLHLAIGEQLVRAGEIPSAYQHLVLALQGDPATAGRARGVLARLPIDPRLLGTLRR